MEAKSKSPCLSQLAVARLASRQRAPWAAEAEHLSTCPTCRALVEEETTLAQAAAQAPLPAAIAALSRSRPASKYSASPTSRVSQWQHGIMAVLAIVGVGMMAQRMVGVPVAAAAPVERAKGPVQVSGTVKDAHHRVRLLDDLSHLGNLQAGDTLQVHVQAFDAAGVTLADANGHAIYFAGKVPVDGWLPVSIEVSAEKPLHLTLQVCTKTPGTPCQSWELR